MSAREIDYTRYYLRYHDDSDSHFEGIANAERVWLRPYMPADKSAPILDIGCGMGFAVAGMLREGYANAEGIDADKGQVAAARKRGLAIEHVPTRDTKRWLSGRSERYALVTAIDVLEHIPPAEHLDFLEGILGLLQKDGKFVCRVPNANSAIAARYRYGDWTHYTSFTEDSLDFVLHNAGFQSIVVEDASPYQWEFRHLRHPTVFLLGCFRLLRRLELIAELGRDRGRKIPLGPNIVAVAQRGALV